MWYHPHGKGPDAEEKYARKYNSDRGYEHQKLFQLFRKEGIDYESMGELQFLVILTL